MIGINGYAVIQNNIFTGFTGSDFRPLVSVNNSTIKNNIFDCFAYIYNYNYTNIGNVEYNNLITASIWYLDPNSVSVNNIANVNLTDIFQNWFGNANFNNFHQLDLHIKPGSVAKNAGTDGTDLGIYGGDGFRKKPSIPFIDYKEVARQTNSQGLLPVNIRVKAQGSN